MYPQVEVLAEVGRITIAGSRLDLWMGLLWSHLDRTLDEDWTRGQAGSQQSKSIRKLARSRLIGEMQTSVFNAVDEAELARHQRNDIVHQDWIVRPAGAWDDHLLALANARSRLPEGHTDDDLDRLAFTSPAWQGVPRDSTAVVAPPDVADLRRLERRLAVVTDRIIALTFQIASSRDCGAPPGYVHLLRETRLVQMQWLVQWLRAADLQRQAASGPGIVVDKQAFAWLFAIAVANVEQGAVAVLGAGHPAVQAFRRSNPEFRDVRDMLEHFGEYVVGRGRLQQQKLVDDFNVFLENSAAGMVVHIAGRKLSVTTSYNAAHQLLIAADQHLDREKLRTGPVG